MSKTLAITVTVGGDCEVDAQQILSGEELLDCCAAAIAAAVTTVEKTWLAAGKTPESAKQAGQCAINRAGYLLHNGGGEMTGGRIDVKG